MILFSFIGPACFADPFVQTLDAVGLAGTYSLEGTTSTNRNVSLSGFGSYQGQVDLGFKNHFRASVGVNYLISNGFSGDTAWGFNFGFKYFPFSWNGAKVQSLNNVQWSFVDQFRPYVGITLKTLQFTTVLASSYNGFGVNGGCHYTLNDRFYLIGEGQYNTLTGNSKNSLNEVGILFGLGVSLK